MSRPRLSSRVSTWRWRRHAPGVLAVLLLGALGACDSSRPVAAREPRASMPAALTAVPGRVAAENYNAGGEGVAYHVEHGDWGTAQPRPDSMDLQANAAASGG